MIEPNGTSVGAAELVRGTVVDVEEGGYLVRLEFETGDAGESWCQALTTCPCGGGRQLLPGEDVLVWRPGGGSAGAVVLGVIGSPLAQARPETLVLEAGRSLTLKVGDGSITIREDGKILIKGTHLVSHATKMNRIRGGSVAIN